MAWGTTMDRLVQEIDRYHLGGPGRNQPRRLDESRPLHVAPFSAMDFDVLEGLDRLAPVISALRQAARSDIDIEENVEIDVLAWYQQAHFFGDDAGIYVLASGVQKLAAYLMASLPGQLREELTDAEVVAILKHAWDLLLAHETFHHSTELAVTAIELIFDCPLYSGGRECHDVEELEEALATSRMLTRHITNEMGGQTATIERHLQHEDAVWFSALPSQYQRGREFVNPAHFANGRRELRHLYFRPLSEGVDLRGIVNYPQAVSDLKSRTYLVWYGDETVPLGAAMAGFTINCREAERILEQRGFARKKGGKHVQLEDAKRGVKVGVPCHGGKDLSLTVIKHIAQAIGVSVAELAQL